MKRLTLMRHAAARWKDGSSDLERPLNRRGIADAQLMARRLLELEFVPDLVLVSPARRAQQTAEIVARELSVPVRRVRPADGLYLASAAELLRVAQAAGPRVRHLLVVGHNPGISQLLQLLVPEGEGTELAAAALCSIAFECGEWAAIGAAVVKDTQCAAPPARLFGIFG